MRVRRLTRTIAGATIWVGGLVWVAHLLSAERGNEGSTFDDIWSYLFRQEIEFELRFRESVLLEVGDAVTLKGGDGRRIGEVAALLDRQGAARPELLEYARGARVRIYDRAWPGLRRDSEARLVRVSGSFAWVLEELVPPEKLRMVANEWRRAWRRDRDAIFAVLRPVLRDLLEDVEETLRLETRAFFDRHRREVDGLLRRAETELDAEELAVLFEDDVWPIMRRHLEPVTDAIGREIWEKLPLWSLSWRLAYQSLPLTRNDYFQRRWKLFMRDEVEPILTSHSADFLTATRSIARETVTNRQVASMLHDLAMRIAGDPGFHGLAQVFVREVFSENSAFRDRMRDRWNSPRVRHAVRFASERLELTVRTIGDILLGTRTTGISPEFARVLRAQILQKGRRRIAIDPGSPSAPLLEAGAVLEAGVETEEAR